MRAPVMASPIRSPLSAVPTAACSFGRRWRPTSTVFPCTPICCYRHRGGTLGRYRRLVGRQRGHSPPVSRLEPGLRVPQCDAAVLCLCRSVLLNRIVPGGRRTCARWSIFPGECTHVLCAHCIDSQRG
eukprot:Amastigsp_a174380_19.p8 type:complete len:128 gc:universal Amastigsp_a174380_19:1847-2230(+)